MSLIVYLVVGFACCLFLAGALASLLAVKQ